jgi:DNA replication and repair protein RecF
LLVKDLRVRNWRNFEDENLRVGGEVTVFFGRNGQGKSNLLEAIYYAFAFRSFRTNSSRDIVRWGCSGAEIEVGFELGGFDRRLLARVENGRRSTTLDGKSVRRDTDSLAGAAAIVFAPEDLRLAKAPAAERRRALDRAVFAVHRPYLREVMAFERALKGRNTLLRRGEATRELLDSYDEILAVTGSRIVLRRRQVVSALAPQFAQAFAEIHGGAAASIRYRSDGRVGSVEGEAEIGEALRRGLAESRGLDQRRGFTGFGPHTDDLEILLGQRLAREHGSQGQIRSLALALKFAELLHVEERNREAPVLLLDDVASELDDVRRQRLFEVIASRTCQTMMTVTERRLLPDLPGRIDWQVREGRVEAAGQEA